MTEGADADLHAIADYTLERWGEDQVQRYAGFLENHFVAIGLGEVRARVVFKHRPEIRVSRCEAKAENGIEKIIQMLQRTGLASVIPK